MEIKISPARFKAYMKNPGVCPLPRCGGSVDGTGEQEFLDCDEIAVGRECDKCGATWDDFYHLADLSKVTMPEKEAV